MIVVLVLITIKFIISLIIKDKTNTLFTIFQKLEGMASLSVFILICGITAKLEESCDSLYEISAIYVFIFWGAFALSCLIGIIYGCIVYIILK